MRALATKNAGSHQMLEEAKSGFSLGALWGNMALLTSRFQLSENDFGRLPSRTVKA